VSARRAAALNGSLGLAELGGSDAHFVQTIGSAYTAFDGRTADDLKRAIFTRRTSAVYGPPVSWRAIGARQIIRQSWRGISATPRAMGWGPTAASFARRVLYRR
jgi:hypothetical protein